MGGKELREGDDEHDGGVLDVDDQVIADLRHDVAQGLRQDDAGHGLHMRHADGFGALGLAGVDGDNAAPDGLGHIGAGIDGDHQNGRHPYAGPLDRIAREVGQAVIDEHGLEHHGRAPEDLHIDPDNHPDQLNEEPFDGRICLGAGDGVEDATYKADDATEKRGHQGQDQGVLNAVEIVVTILFP